MKRFLTLICVTVVLLGSCNGATGPNSMASVQVVPPADTLFILGTAQQYTALALDLSGGRLSTNVFAWSSSDTSVAQVSATTGVVTAVGNGKATITATAGGVAGSAQVTVNGVLTLVPITLARVSTGGLSTCGTTRAGAAYCWGDNSVGELGNGTTTNSRLPVAVAGGLTFTVVSVGYGFACGTTSGGTAYCWGANVFGGLGDGEFTITRATPTAVAGGLTFSVVSAGALTACGLTLNGAAYCWGHGGDGELGDSTMTNSAVPVEVAGGLAFATISVGDASVCGVTLSGAAYCWGDNGAGQLGNGTTSGPERCPGGDACASVPVAVEGGLTFKTVSTGSVQTCGVTTVGDGWCWGDNSDGQLGNGTYGGTDQPQILTGLLGTGLLSSVTVGHKFACGVAKAILAGVAYCWGDDAAGELGTQMWISNTVPVPVPVLGGFTYQSLSAGGSSACGVTSGGATLCWGTKDHGPLGAPRVAEALGRITKQ